MEAAIGPTHRHKQLLSQRLWNQVGSPWTGGGFLMPTLDQFRRFA